MHERCLGDGIRGICGDVADGNPALAAGIHVDIVYAGPGLADELELRGMGKEFLVHDDLITIATSQSAARLRASSREE